MRAEAFQARQDLTLLMKLPRKPPAPSRPNLAFHLTLQQGGTGAHEQRRRFCRRRVLDSASKSYRECACDRFEGGGLGGNEWFTEHAVVASSPSEGTRVEVRGIFGAGIRTNMLLSRSLRGRCWEMISVCGRHAKARCSVRHSCKVSQQVMLVEVGSCAFPVILAKYLSIFIK
jgi:hypothetical protein